MGIPVCSSCLSATVLNNIYNIFLYIIITCTYNILYTVCIKIKVIHFQMPIVLNSIDLNICMWPILSKEQLFFPLVPFLHHVTHDRVHCHWKLQCHIPLFASFGNWDGRLQWMPSLVIQMDEFMARVPFGTANRPFTLHWHCTDIGLFRQGGCPKRNSFRIYCW